MLNLLLNVKELTLNFYTYCCELFVFVGNNEQGKDRTVQFAHIYPAY